MLPSSESSHAVRVEAPIEHVSARAFRVPTATQKESDGTAEWTHTTLALVELEAAGVRGLGYTYADAATARFVAEVLLDALLGADAFDLPSLHHKLRTKVRNHGTRGVAACAISAVDVAAWDLKARLLDVPLCRLLGQARKEIAAYGSGGFTSYDEGALVEQLSGWASDGFSRVKMKVGRDPSADPRRVRVARAAIGDEVELYVDGNGAYDRKEALRLAQLFAAHDVRWFEEPVSSDDREGLRLLRDRAPAAMEITAGEYGYAPDDFRLLLEAGAVDVLMADATRCLGFTGFLNAAALCEAFHLPLSAHCAPALHLHVCLAAPKVRHLEFFYDHARIERLFFDGFREPKAGVLTADLSRPGHGLELKLEDAAQFEVKGTEWTT